MPLTAWRKSIKSRWFSSCRKSIHDRRREFGAEVSRLSPTQHAELLEVRTLLCGPDDAWVATNRHDYAPGDTAVITGGNFQIGETIQLQVLHTDGTPNTGGGHDPWFVTDGGGGDLDGLANGQIQTTWYVNPDDSAGSAFDLKAIGSLSAEPADTTFTDSGIIVGSVTTNLRSAASGDVASTTFSHTVPAGSDRLLVVSVMTEGNESATSITYNGKDLTPAVSQPKQPGSGSANTTAVEIWYLVAPDVGTFNLMVTFSNTSPFGVTATNLTGVSQFSPIGAIARANGASGSPSVSLTTTASNSLIFGAATKDNETSTFTPGANVSELWDTRTGTGSEDLALWGGTRSTTTAGKYTLNATASSATDDWSLAAIEIKMAVDNPLLPNNACDLDMVLVMDISNSIDATELVSLKSALTAFVNAFDSHENTRFGLVTLNSTAQLIDLGSGVTFTDDGSIMNAAINSQTTRGGAASGTDWKDALPLARNLLLAQGRAQFPDLIVFASDGNPDGGTLDSSIDEANAAKQAGMRILTIGIGTDVNADNMEALSGPNQAPPFNKDTDFVPSTFDNLPQDLVNLADALCPNIQVIEKVNGDDANTAPGVVLTTAGQTLTYTFDVTTTSSSGLSNITLTDNVLGSPNPVLQPDLVHNVGDLNDDNRLDVGETWQYSATAPALTGQRTNTATVTGTSPTNAMASDTDSANYLDPTPDAVTVEDVTAVEGVGLVFTVTLNNLVPGGTVVNVTLSDVTATGGAALITPVDYNNVVAALSFVGTAGETKRFTVATLNDAMLESPETFTVSLNAVNPLVTDTDTATGTITDNTLSISDVTVTEGGNAVFVVTLAQKSSSLVQVNYTTANGTAVSGDYLTKKGSLIFGVGQTSKTLSIPIISDTRHEADETFFINLTDAVNAALTDSQGQCTIIDDDAAPTLSIKNVAVTEGTGKTVNATFTVLLSAVSGLPVTVDYATADDTSAPPNTAATAGADYTSMNSSLTIDAGQTRKTFTVPIVGDALHELSETFLVNLSNAAGATLSISQAIGKINDNDAAPKLTISNVTVTETVGGTFAVFTVKLSAASGLLVTANFATTDGTAKAGSDYTGISGGSVTFNPGDTTQLISVAVGRDDLLHGPIKTFKVQLSDALNHVFAQGIGTILDDD